MTAPDALFVAWIGQNGRTQGLAKYLGIEAAFIRSDSRLLPVRYARQWAATGRLLHARRPRVVLVMQPPILALLPVLLYARAAGARVIADLHTGVFADPKWRWASRLLMRLLAPSGTVIVTNEALARITRARGIETLVLHDLIEPITRVVREAALPAGLEEDSFVLVPVAYAHDEPLQEILAAASASPDLRWVLTGRAPDSLVRQAPANVLFPGFVDDAVFQRLLTTAGVVLAATTEEHTMQRSGYEALSAGRPLVTTDTAVLREYFGDAAPHVPADGPGILAGVRTVLARRDFYLQAMLALRDERMHAQQVSLEALRMRVQAASPGADGRRGPAV
ncbi:MAG: glycosyl transferase group 1 [Naasia sp.]|uniref:glycosyltransferase n=1 Tax=Naasia sp. TaxID=2546198 RepID=UPI00260630C3|nr:glycosyltransferase [Naasia sp.]MCU1569982.1 glycosyl transferase group 1 [Naasia sp.]